MKRAARAMAAMLVVCAIGVAWMPEVYAKDDGEAKAKPKPKPKASKARAEKCVHLSEKRVDDTTMTFALENGCGAARECTIKWSVTCDGGTREDHQEQSYLTDGDSSQWRVSAAMCGDEGFIISPPKWSCTIPAPAAAAN